MRQRKESIHATVFHSIAPLNNSCAAFTDPSLFPCVHCRWQSSLDLLEQMREQGLTPDTMSYNAAIAACARSSKVDEALALLKEALGRKVADVVTYNSAMQVGTRRIEGGGW